MREQDGGIASEANGRLLQGLLAPAQGSSSPSICSIAPHRCAALCGSRRRRRPAGNNSALRASSVQTLSPKWRARARCICGRDTCEEAPFSVGTIQAGMSSSSEDYGSTSNASAQAQGTGAMHSDGKAPCSEQSRCGRSETCVMRSK
eukprot:3770230-Pleurochrysis_carterae.AAC.1